MVIRKGSIYWVDFSPGKGSEPIGRRPGLVVQNDILNDSNLNTVIMLAITSTMKFKELPGNVGLKKGEANVPKKCVVNVTQIKSVDKKSIKEKIGTLPLEARYEPSIRCYTLPLLRSVLTHSTNKPITPSHLCNSEAFLRIFLLNDKNKSMNSNE
jgi:mRNA interferase MazF